MIYLISCDYMRDGIQLDAYATNVEEIEALITYYCKKVSGLDSGVTVNLSKLQAVAYSPKNGLTWAYFTLIPIQPVGSISLP
jgi:hypothetical protein